MLGIFLLLLDKHGHGRNLLGESFITRHGWILRGHGFRVWKWIMLLWTGKTWDLRLGLGTRKVDQKVDGRTWTDLGTRDLKSDDYRLYCYNNSLECNKEGEVPFYREKIEKIFFGKISKFFQNVPRIGQFMTSSSPFRFFFKFLGIRVFELVENFWTVG